MKEVKLKENNTGRIILVGEFPKLANISPEALDVFIKSYEMAICEMFKHKRTKKSNKNVE